MKPITLALILTLIVSCVPSKDVTPKSTVGKINSSAPFLWSSSAFPINLMISSDFDTNEISNIQSMSSAWETVIENKINLFNNTELTSEVSSPSMSLDAIGEDSVFGVYRIVHWPRELNSGALAVTQILGTRHNIGTNSEHVLIQLADILVNEDLYDFRTNDTVGTTYDLRTVILHEMGHFLGLGHKYGNTVMVPAISGSTSNRSPSSVDALDIADKYGVTLGSGSARAISTGEVIDFRPQGPGEPVKILIELMADGACIHTENGVVVKHHSPE